MAESERACFALPMNYLIERLARPIQKVIIRWVPLQKLHFPVFRNVSHRLLSIVEFEQRSAIEIFDFIMSGAAQAFIAFLRCEAKQSEERAKSLRATAATIEANNVDGKPRCRSRMPI